MNDIECPYCGKEQEINHDDGYGYEEDSVHEQECGDCDKAFVFTTSILFSYKAAKADCLNGKDHKYKATHTFPKKFTRMQCVDCNHERKPTTAEMQSILGS